MTRRSSPTPSPSRAPLRRRSLLVTCSGTGSATGAVADGLGRIQIDRVTNFAVLLVDVLGVSSVFGPAPRRLRQRLRARRAPVDQVHSVKREATARAQADAGLYQLVFSDDLAVVPEPALGLLAAAAVGAGALRRRALR